MRFYEARSDDDEPDHDAEAGLEEQLVRSYADFLRGSVHFLTEAELACNLRGACECYPSFRRDTTDEQLLEAAQACYEGALALRARRNQLRQQS